MSACLFLEIFIVISLCGGSLLAHAEDEGDSHPSRFEVTLSGGTALQTGYLTSQRSESTYDVGFHFHAPRGLLSVEWQGFSANHNTGEFDLQNNSSVSVTTISLISHFQVAQVQNWLFYVGLGVTDIFLEQSNPTYQSSYGSVIFAGMIEYYLSEKWSLHYKTQWYNMEQTINNQKTSFEVWNHFLGVGYSF